MKCILSSHATAENRSSIVGLIRDYGFNCISVSDKSELFAKTSPLDSDVAIFISDRTKFIIPEDYVTQAKFLMINTHPSMLPFHKGSLPVFWSTLLGSSLGVTLHKIEPGVDDGDIFSQRQLAYNEGMTFREAHTSARIAIVEDLTSLLGKVSRGEVLSFQPQSPGLSSHHLLKDGQDLLAQLPRGWDTTIREARTILASTVELFHSYSLT